METVRYSQLEELLTTTRQELNILMENNQNNSHLNVADRKTTVDEMLRLMKIIEDTEDEMIELESM